MKLKKMGGGVGSGGGGGGSGWVGGQCGCKRRIEVFVKIHKKWGVGWGEGRLRGVRVDVNEELKFFKKIHTKKIGGGGGVGGVRVVGGQGGCERRIEVFVKIQKKIGGGGSGRGGGVRGRVGGGVSVDVNEELMFF